MPACCLRCSAASTRWSRRSSCAVLPRNAFAVAATHPGVTILKPLRGAEPALSANLASFCEQDYRGPVQVLFGVADPADAAIAVVDALIRDRPAADLRLCMTTGARGANPKVANLAAMQSEIAHDIVVIADSDIAVDRDYLARLIAALGATRRGARHLPVSRRAAWRTVGATRGDGHRLPFPARRARRTGAGTRAAVFRLDDRAAPRNAAGDRRFRRVRRASRRRLRDRRGGARGRADGGDTAADRAPRVFRAHGVRVAAARVALGTNAARGEPRRLRRARRSRIRSPARCSGRHSAARGPLGWTIVAAAIACRLVLHVQVDHTLGVRSRTAGGSVRRATCLHSQSMSQAFSSTSSAGAAIAIGSAPTERCYRREIRKHDAHPVPAGTVVRRIRRRRGLALPGAARDPLVLVSDVACAAGSAGRGQQARRCAAARPEARRHRSRPRATSISPSCTRPLPRSRRTSRRSRR